MPVLQRAVTSEKITVAVKMNPILSWVRNVKDWNIWCNPSQHLANFCIPLEHVRIAEADTPRLAIVSNPLHGDAGDHDNNAVVRQQLRHEGQIPIHRLQA